MAPEYSNRPPAHSSLSQEFRALGAATESGFVDQERVHKFAEEKNVTEVINHIVELTQRGSELRRPEARSVLSDNIRFMCLHRPGTMVAVAQRLFNSQGLNNEQLDFICCAISTTFLFDQEPSQFKLAKYALLSERVPIESKETLIADLFCRIQTTPLAKETLLSVLADVKSADLANLTGRWMPTFPQIAAPFLFENWSDFSTSTKAAFAISIAKTASKDFLNHEARAYLAKQSHEDTALFLLSGFAQKSDLTKYPVLDKLKEHRDPQVQSYVKWLLKDGPTSPDNEALFIIQAAMVNRWSDQQKLQSAVAHVNSSGNIHLLKQILHLDSGFYAPEYMNVFYKLIPAINDLTGDVAIKFLADLLRKQNHCDGLTGDVVKIGKATIDAEAGTKFANKLDFTKRDPSNIWIEKLLGSWLPQAGELYLRILKDPKTPLATKANLLWGYSVQKPGELSSQFKKEFLALLRSCTVSSDAGLRRESLQIIPRLGWSVRELKGHLKLMPYRASEHELVQNALKSMTFLSFLKDLVARFRSLTT